MNAEGKDSKTKMEIERKFLVKKIPFNLEKFKKYEIRQAYLSYPKSEETVRLRQQDDTYYRTIKTKGSIARVEIETKISKEEFEKDWLKKVSGVVSKTRYLIPHGEFTIELDIYKDALSGLITAEVEFESLDKCELYTPPEWFDAEVTKDFRYRNNNLASYGLPNN